MRKNAPKTTSLVFARRRTNLHRSKRGKKNFPIKKGFFIILILFLGAGSVYAGHLFAKNSKIPVFIENKAPEKVIQPVVQAREKEASIEELLASSGIAFEEITYATTSSTVVITLQENSFAYINRSENVQGQLEVLSKIISRMKIENPGKKIGYIDLRYDRPIVKF